MTIVESASHSWVQGCHGLALLADSIKKNELTF